MSFRPHSIQVSGPVFNALRAMTATRGYDCPDALADAILDEALAKIPEVAFRRQAFVAAMKDIDARAEIMFRPKPSTEANQ
jgi:hypothetical protein